MALVWVRLAELQVPSDAFAIDSNMVQVAVQLVCSGVARRGPNSWAALSLAACGEEIGGSN